MESVETRQEVVELRDEAFRLAESLSREATLSETLEAATTLQSVAYMLGQVERSLVGTRQRDE